MIMPKSKDVPAMASRSSCPWCGSGQGFAYLTSGIAKPLINGVQMLTTMFFKPKDYMDFVLSAGGNQYFLVCNNCGEQVKYCVKCDHVNRCTHAMDKCPGCNGF
jgi:hypothetical protein